MDRKNNQGTEAVSKCKDSRELFEGIMYALDRDLVPGFDILGISGEVLDLLLGDIIRMMILGPFESRDLLIKLIDIAA